MGGDLRYFQEVREETRIDAAAEVMSWGYPRPIDDDEAKTSTWIMYGEDVLFWFRPGLDPESLTAHICASPSGRGHLGTGREMMGVEIIAELLGAKRLYSVTGFPGQDPRLPRRAMRRFLRMKGWEVTEFGNYKDLGG